MESERKEHIQTISKEKGRVGWFGLESFCAGNSLGIFAKRLQYCNNYYELITPAILFAIFSYTSIRDYNKLRLSKEA